MACDVMAVRLHLPQVRVLEVVEDTPGALRVGVESMLLRLRFANCGLKCHRVHDRRARKVRDLEVSGRAVTLVWSRRRMVCDNCDSRFLEDHHAFEGALTARLARRPVADCKVMTVQAAARRAGLRWHRVQDLVDAWSALVAERRRSRRCSVLLVDETSMRRRHRYVTVIVNGDCGRTLAMVEHRSSAALSALLAQQGHRWCRQVKVVVSDGSRAYKAAIGAHLGHARHVLDRFHVIRWFCAGLTAVRRDVQRREPHGATVAFDPEVFRARFVLLRRGDTLTDADRARLDGLFDAHPRLKAGRQALQELHSLYTADDYDGALDALGRFYRPLRDGRSARVPRHRRHVHRMVRGDPRLAPRRPGHQRRHRGRQQPATSPATHRPRVHQPTQLRGPRHPDNMTPNRCQQPSIPRFREGPDELADSIGGEVLQGVGGSPSRRGPPPGRCRSRQGFALGDRSEHHQLAGDRLGERVASSPGVVNGRCSHLSHGLLASRRRNCTMQRRGGLTSQQRPRASGPPPPSEGLLIAWRAQRRRLCEAGQDIGPSSCWAGRTDFAEA